MDFTGDPGSVWHSCGSCIEFSFEGLRRPSFTSLLIHTLWVSWQALRIHPVITFQHACESCDPRVFGERLRQGWQVNRRISPQWFTCEKKGFTFMETYQNLWRPSVSLSMNVKMPLNWKWNGLSSSSLMIRDDGWVFLSFPTPQKYNVVQFSVTSHVWLLRIN